MISVRGVARAVVVAAVLVSCINGIAPCAWADTVPINGLFNTGVNSNGGLLADGAIDPHYTLISSPNQAFLGSNTFVFGKNSTWLPPFEYPFPFWTPNTLISQWITPFTDSSFPLTWLPSGVYTYSTTFFLPDTFNPSADEAFITGMWATDNNAIDILINGQSTGNSIPTNGAFYSLHPFSIRSGFEPGLNTLNFIFNNDGPGASGIQVQMQGDGIPEPAPVPEPVSLVSGAMGLACVGAYLRRRRRMR